MKNQNLAKAKAKKNDEFYTRLEDIETELSHYSEKYFRDKTIYLPCDVAIDDNNVPKSNFVKYFQINRVRLGYKKLIATSINNKKNLYILDKEGKEFYGYCPADSEYVSGDYRSAYCQKLFKEADVVVTNPPFSLFRDFVPYLIKHNVNYLVLGGQNAVTYKELFNYIKENKMWLGNVPMGVPLLFIVDEEYQQVLKETKKEGTGYKIVNGTVYARVPSIWFTNMDYKKRHEEILLIKKYDANAYPKYDNYDAIEVNKVTDIPCDWDGVIGVPISFLSKFNPDQFEIVGCADADILPEGWKGASKEIVEDYYKQGNKGQIKEGWRNPIFYDKTGKVIAPYKRILIRRKKDK